MKQKEKLKEALDALYLIGYNSDEIDRGTYARKIYTELTAPRMEEVVYRADSQSPNSVWYKDERGYTVKSPKDAEILIKFNRAVEESEDEELEREVRPQNPTAGFVKGLPPEWIGETVLIRRKS